MFCCIYISSHSSSIKTQTFLEQHLLGESLCIFKNTTRIALLLLLFWSLLFRSVPVVGSTIGRFSWVSSTLYGCNGELMTELGQLSLFACLESRVTRIHFVLLQEYSGDSLKVNLTSISTFITRISTVSSSIVVGLQFLVSTRKSCLQLSPQ